MKRMILIIGVLLAVIVIALLAVLSITEKKPDFPEDQQLKNLLTKTYNLQELEAYIKPGNARNAFSPYREWAYPLQYEELNARYPVEVFRTHEDVAYTVYNVSQGGYYYVFWGFFFPNEEARSGTNDWSDKEHACVYFSTYIGKSVDVFRYLKLRIGTTYGDVMILDPNNEYCTTANRRSCSYLNDKYVLLITYRAIDNFSDAPDSPESIVVSRIEIVARNMSPSYFQHIYSCDLP